MSFKRPSKDLEWKILTEEVDEATGEELPEKDTLNEELFEGDTTGADLVKEIYREAKYVKFRLDQNSVYGAIQMTILISIFLLIPFILILLILLPIRKADWYFYIFCLLGMLFISAILSHIWLGVKEGYYDGYFFKRGNKTTTFYLPRGGKDRGLIVYFNQNKIFQLQNGEFVNIAETTKREFMGNRLMFNRLNGRITSKQKKEILRIHANNGTYQSTLFIKPNYKMMIKTTLAETAYSTLETLHMDEYNSGNDVLELPESFKALCEQVGVKPLENEHIKYI